MELECLRILKIGQKFNITKKSTKINIFFRTYGYRGLNRKYFAMVLYRFFMEIFDQKCLFLSGYFSEENFLDKIEFSAEIETLSILKPDQSSGIV